MNAIDQNDIIFKYNQKFSNPVVLVIESSDDSIISKLLIIEIKILNELYDLKIKDTFDIISEPCNTKWAIVFDEDSVDEPNNLIKDIKNNFEPGDICIIR